MANKEEQTVRQIVFDGVNNDLKKVDNFTLTQLKYDGSCYCLHIKNKKAYALTSSRVSKKTGLLNEKLDNLPWLKTIEFPFEKETILVTEVVAEHLYEVPRRKRCNFVAGIMNSSPSTLAESYPDGAPLALVVHDCLMMEGVDVSKEEYRDRFYKVTTRHFFPEAGYFGEKIREKGIYRIHTLTIVNLLRLFVEPHEEPYPCITEETFNIVRKEYKDLLTSIPRSSENLLSFVQRIVQLPGFDLEGFVLKGAVKGMLKIKKEHTGDVVIIGYTDGTGKYSGLIGALILGALNDDGEMVEVGKCSGMTDDLRREISANKKKYLNSIIEVEFMEWTGKKLRHPRFMRLRDDKEIKRCTVKKLED